MPVTDQSDPSAISAARAEAQQWMAIATHWDGYTDPGAWSDVAPSESAVVRFYSPAEDLNKRGAGWMHELAGEGLSDVARFAAGLAVTEADAWRDDQPHIATRAYADRRFLGGDRIVHWAVPWLDTVGRCYPDFREQAHEDRDAILAIADFHRPAPDMGSGLEGLYPPGHDSFGPVEPGTNLTEWLGSLWSGGVLMRSTLESITGVVRTDAGVTEQDLADAGLRSHLAILYGLFSARWRSLASAHPGTARLWMDLSARAVRTAHWLSG